MDHLVFGVVLYGGLLHRDSTLHLYSNQVLGMTWRFGLLLAALEEVQVSQEQQQHMDVRNYHIIIYIYICIYNIIYLTTKSLGCMQKKYNSPKGSVTKDD